MAETSLTRELLGRLLAGDYEAERQLFETQRVGLLRQVERHRRFRWIARGIGAEDIVQEVFWRALSAQLLTRFEVRGRGALAALLTTILERTLIDAVRRARSLKRGGATSIGSLEDAAEPPLESKAGRTQAAPSAELELRELLGLCRSTLATEEWETWQAIDLRGLSLRQLADASGSAESTLRRRLGLAREKLQRAIGRSARAGQGGSA